MDLHEKIWRESLAKTGGLGRIMPGIQAQAEEFFIPDRINPLSFVANFQLLLAPEAGAPPTPHAEPTPSVRSFLSAESRPSGLPLWFIASYPDICLWLQSQTESQEEFWAQLVIQAFGPEISEDFKAQDAQGCLRPELLRRLVDHYVALGKSLECATPTALSGSAETSGAAGSKPSRLWIWIAAAFLLSILLALGMLVFLT